MRGRRPCPLSIGSHDRALLQEVARSQTLPWYQVRRARTALAIAAGQRTTVVASRLECDVGTVRRTCRRYHDGGVQGLLEEPQRPGRTARISPLQRAQIVELACLELVAKGLHITHWSSEDLARQAVADRVVESISPRTARLILDRVDLQPHRTRYWRTTRLEDRFKARAEKVLWCYANAERLARRGYWVVRADEIPNFQVLRRHPIRRAIPGSIEQREFDYTRHGTVNILTFLVVHSGRMQAVILERNDAANYIPALKAFRRRHRRLRGIYPIHDGGPSHIAGTTTEYFDGCHGWWRPCLTPARASWLDRAELLIHAFGDRYLKRGSWGDREELIRHVADSWPEDNELYAHPFEWTWTNQEDETLVRETWWLNFGRYFVPGTLRVIVDGQDDPLVPIRRV